MTCKIAAFSHRGVLLAKKLQKELGLSDAELSFFNREDKSGNELHPWVKESFENCDRLIFIGAVQIAVRLISKELKSKLTDPAVVVIDDNGKYCIPILSGHVGSANEFAGELASILGAEAVITTSTDINNKFAIDVFARKNELVIKNPHRIKDVSSKLLRGENIKIYSCLPIEGKLPEGVFWGNEEEADAVITPFKTENETALLLIPKLFTLGVGCKKDTDEKHMSASLEEFLSSAGIYKEAILNMATIDLKKEEKAVLALSEKLKIPVSFYTSDQLAGAMGKFTPSQFVKAVTGVDNVCERSAALLSKGSIKIAKTAFKGITFALAQNEKLLNIGEK